MNQTRPDGRNKQPASKEDKLAELSRSADNIKRIKGVQDKFVNSQILQKEGRALIGEGVLLKVCRKGPKQRIFFLFSDILVYGQIVINGRKYSQQKIIPLNEIKIESTTDSYEKKWAWLIRSPKKSFIVMADSERERQQWLAHLDQCIRSATAGNNTQNSAVAAHWIPDNTADTCMHCKSSKFSAYNRRHHCRNCGYIVCDACSKRRFLLQHLDSKPVRVCDTCFTALSAPNTSDTHLSKQEQTADSSDSDGDEGAQELNLIPPTFYENVENM